MEPFWQFLLDISANHITRYGLYIPGDPYRLILWNELLVLVLSFALVIMFFRLKGMKRMLARVRTMTGRLPRPRVMTRSAPRYSGSSETLGAIEQAMASGCNVLMWYRDAEGELTERVVRPAEIYRVGMRTYLKGFCYLRNDEREFRVDRIVNIRQVLTPPQSPLSTVSGGRFDAM